MLLRSRDRQCRRSLLVEAFGGCQLRPTADDDLHAVADLILVHAAVESVAVHIESIGIERRRRRGVAAGASVIDAAAVRWVLMAPYLRAALGIERNDVTCLGCDE